MTILFFDTETTGLPQRNLPLNHASQPRLVQLAAILADDDGAERGSLACVVKPDGWTIPAGATAVHGIDDAMAARVGIPLSAALAALRGLTLCAERVVAHNVAFDVEIVQMAFYQVDRPEPATWFGGLPRACTMTIASPIVNLPPTDRMLAAGFNKPKPPKLEECIRHFFNEDLAGAHDALIDVRACARLYRHLQERKAA